MSIQITQEYLAGLLKTLGYKIAETNACVLHPETNEAMVTFELWERYPHKWSNLLEFRGVKMFPSAQVYGGNYRVVYNRISLAKFTADLFVEKIESCYQKSLTAYELIKEDKVQREKAFDDMVKRQEAVRLQVIDTYRVPDKFTVSWESGNKWNVHFEIKEEVRNNEN